jgi:hypothetical protein
MTLRINLNLSVLTPTTADKNANKTKKLLTKIRPNSWNQSPSAIFPESYKGNFYRLVAIDLH